MNHPLDLWKESKTRILSEEEFWNLWHWLASAGRWMSTLDSAEAVEKARAKIVEDQSKLKERL